MFTITRMIRFKNAPSMMAAMPICIQIVDYFNKVHKIESHLLTPTLGGHPTRVLFVLRSDDLVAVQDIVAKAGQDKKWVSLVNKLSEFVDGSATNDQTWKTVV